MNPNLVLALLGAAVIAASLKLASARSWQKLSVGEFHAGTAEREDPPPPPRSQASNNSFAVTEVRNLMAHNRIKGLEDDPYLWERLGGRLSNIDRALPGDPVAIPANGDVEVLARLLDQLELKAGFGPLPAMKESDSK